MNGKNDSVNVINFNKFRRLKDVKNQIFLKIIIKYNNITLIVFYL